MRDRSARDDVFSLRLVLGALAIAGGNLLLVGYGGVSPLIVNAAALAGLGVLLTAARAPRAGAETTASEGQLLARASV